MLRVLFYLLFFSFFISPPASAQDSVFKNLRAESEVDVNYDPFSDYSEFEEVEEDEEADLTFFRSGRFFNVGFLGGWRAFTQTYGKYQEPNIVFGLFANFFFDLRLAVYYSLMTGHHTFELTHNSERISFNFRGTQHSVGLKYYLNAHSLTPDLAAFSPYIAGGMAYFIQSSDLAGSEDQLRQAFIDKSLAFDVGLGLEFPILRKKLYIGIEAFYHLINFRSEGAPIRIGDEDTNIVLKGDAYSINLIVGLHF